MRRTLRGDAALLLCALLALPACIEVHYTIDVDSDGSGKARSELAVEKMLLMGQSVEDLKKSVLADAKKDGVDARFVSQREEGGKIILVFEQRFTKCSQLNDRMLQHDCLSGDAGPSRRVHRLRLVTGGGFPGSLTVKARLPGRVELSNGNLGADGSVTWSGNSAMGTMYAVSSTRAPLRLAGLSTSQKLLTGAGLLSGAAATAGLVWLALRVRPWLRRPKRFCTKCGQAAKPAGRFCNSCGSELPAPRTMVRPNFTAPLGLAAAGGLLALGALSFARPSEGPRETVEQLAAAVAQGRLPIAQVAFLGGDLFMLEEKQLAAARLRWLGSPAYELRFEKEEVKGNTAQVSLSSLNAEGTEMPITAALELSLGAWRITRWDVSAAPRGWERIGDSQTVRLRCGGPSRDDVLRELQLAVRSNPRDAGLAQELGSCYELAGDLDAAERAFQSAMAIYPERVVIAAHSLASLYKKRGDPSKAEQTWRDIMARKPEDYMAILGLADLLAEQGSKLDEAVSLAQKALTLDPQNAWSPATLGWAYYKKGDQANAAKYLGEAVQKAPGNTVFRSRYEEATTTVDDLMARAQQNRAWGRYEEAIAGYDAALRKDPGNATAQQQRAQTIAEQVQSHVGRAQQLLSAQRYDDAIAECDRALQLAPEDASAADLKRRIIETKKILGYQ